MTKLSEDSANRSVLPASAAGDQNKWLERRCRVGRFHFGHNALSEKKTGVRKMGSEKFPVLIFLPPFF
jgi:hypothetical protein